MRDIGVAAPGQQILAHQCREGSRRDKLTSSSMVKKAVAIAIKAGQKPTSADLSYLPLKLGTIFWLEWTGT